MEVGSKAACRCAANVGRLKLLKLDSLHDMVPLDAWKDVGSENQLILAGSRNF